VTTQNKQLISMKLTTGSSGLTGDEGCKKYLVCCNYPKRCDKNSTDEESHKPIETMSPGMSSSVITGRHFLLR